MARASRHLFLALALSSTSSAFADGITCDFSDPAALNRLYAQARTRAAPWTRSDGAGGFIYCMAAYEPGCWHWIQDGTFELFPSRQYSRLRVEAANHFRFELNFEDPTLDPYCRAMPSPDDGLGAGVGRHIDPTDPHTTCTAADWAHEPRYLTSGYSDEIISVWVEGMRRDRTFVGGPGRVSPPASWSSTGARLFDLASFRNRGPHPVTLQVKWYDGSWSEWEDLGTGVHDMSGLASWILEARLFTTGGVGYIALDDIVTTNIQLN